ncbi:MAG: hypothetical protein IJE09_00530 [Oscillospiraceae bacterium]|nr:hypothetical protein [Oscillospiraceae bacterium]
MNIRSLFVNESGSGELRSAILGHSRHNAREERKMKCQVCGNVHVGTGAQTLCPVCKRPGANSYILL